MLKILSIVCTLYNKADEVNTHTHRYTGKKDNFCLGSIMIYIEITKDTTKFKKKNENPLPN